MAKHLNASSFLSQRIATCDTVQLDHKMHFYELSRSVCAAGI